MTTVSCKFLSAMEMDTIIHLETEQQDSREALLKEAISYVEARQPLVPTSRQEEIVRISQERSRMFRILRTAEDQLRRLHSGFENVSLACLYKDSQILSIPHQCTGCKELYTDILDIAATRMENMDSESDDSGYVMDIKSCKVFPCGSSNQTHPSKCWACNKLKIEWDPLGLDAIQNITPTRKAEKMKMETKEKELEMKKERVFPCGARTRHPDICWACNRRRDMATDAYYYYEQLN